jgi:hypothetical protein
MKHFETLNGIPKVVFAEAATLSLWDDSSVKVVLRSNVVPFEIESVISAGKLASMPCYWSVLVKYQLVDFVASFEDSLRENNRAAR